MACNDGTTNNNGTAVVPDLTCPVNLNQNIFRFIDPKQIGIANGASTIATLNLSGFLMPVDTYGQAIMLIKKNEVKRLLSANMDNGIRSHEFSFDLSTVTFGATSTALLTITLSNGSTDTLTIPAPDVTNYATFVTALTDAISTDSGMNVLISFKENLDPTTPNTFVLKTVEQGITATTATLFIGPPTLEITIPNVLVQTAIRYPFGRYKGFALTVEFCLDCDSNEKYLEFAFDDEYQANPSTATWRKLGQLLIMTGTADLLETDLNKIETIWLRNTQDCTVKVTAITVN